MVIADFFSNHSRCKIATKSMDHHQHESATTTSKASKLSQFFKKLTHPALTSHHSSHRHLLKRPSMAQMNPPIFQSDSQIPIIDHRPDPDKDKMYERRRYQETTKRMQHQLRHLPMDYDYLPHQSKQSTTFYGNASDSTNFIRRRPSLTTSPSFDEIPPRHPSFPSSGRNSTINANIHSDDNSTSSNDNFGDDGNTEYIHSKYTDGGNNIKHGNDDDNDGKGDVLGNPHGHDTSELNGISLEQQSSAIDTTRQPKYDTSILSIERLSPIIISDDSMVMEQTTQTTQLVRKISAPLQQQQHHVPWVLQELRRMNTISNNSLSTQDHQHHESSLQRNRSYVIRKGRFEISIEPSD